MIGLWNSRFGKSKLSPAKFSPSLFLSKDERASISRVSFSCGFFHTGSFSVLGTWDEGQELGQKNYSYFRGPAATQGRIKTDTTTFCSRFVLSPCLRSYYMVLLLLLQVSWAHKPVDKDGLDLLTIGNSTYTLEPRISAQFLHPANWGLKISNIQPEDAGTYICQISTFPPKVRILFLEIQGMRPIRWTLKIFHALAWTENAFKYTPKASASCHPITFACICIHHAKFLGPF